MRAGIIDILIRDQLRLNLAGVIVGFVVSLIVFRSLIGAVMTAVPAIVAGLGGARRHGTARRAGDGDVEHHPGAGDDRRLCRRHPSQPFLATSPRRRSDALAGRAPGPGAGRRGLHADRDHHVGLVPRAHHLRRRDPPQLRLDRRDRHAALRHDRPRRPCGARPVHRAVLEGQAWRPGTRSVQAACRAMRRDLPFRRRPCAEHLAPDRRAVRGAGLRLCAVSRRLFGARASAAGRSGECRPRPHRPALRRRLPDPDHRADGRRRRHLAGRPREDQGRPRRGGEDSRASSRRCRCGAW